MTEIQRLLTETIEDLNEREKRDNRPRFSISFIRKHPGLFIGMYIAWLATLAGLLPSDTLGGSGWLVGGVFFLPERFFFFFGAPPSLFEDIGVPGPRGCFHSGGVKTRFCPPAAH